MAKIWRNRIIAETQSFSDCPERYQDDVKALLRADVENGVITPEQYEQFTGEVYAA